MSPLYYDRDGRAIGDVHEWAALFEDMAYKVVRSDYIGNVHVSTVWLGLDHQLGAGPPLIFETMVFGGPLDQEMERYGTNIAGHEAMVHRVQQEVTA